MIKKSKLVIYSGNCRVNQLPILLRWTLFAPPALRRIRGGVARDDCVILRVHRYSKFLLSGLEATAPFRPKCLGSCWRFV